MATAVTAPKREDYAFHCIYIATNLLRSLYWKEEGEWVRDSVKDWAPKKAFHPVTKFYQNYTKRMPNKAPEIKAGRKDESKKPSGYFI